MFGPSSTPQSSEDLLLSIPYNKFEIGRYLDANASYNRNYGPKTAFTTQTTDDVSFQMVDSKARTAYAPAVRTRSRTQAKQKWQKSQIALTKNNQQRSAKASTTRDPLMVSIDLQPEWKPTMSLPLKFISRYQADKLKVDCEDVQEAVNVPSFNNEFNQTFFQKIQPIERTPVPITSLANDPIVKSSSADIIISADILARLMCVAFSSYGFDLNLTKRGTQLIFDWDDDQGILEWVNENNELIQNLPFKEAKALAMESAELSQTFKNMASDSAKHYTYKEYTVNADGKSTRILVRGVVDATDITVKRSYNSEGIVEREEIESFECLHAILENKFEHKTVEWAKKLNNKQNVLSEILKTEAFKIATWLIAAKLSGCENFRTAFVQRMNPTTPNGGHKLLGTRKDSIDILLSSMNITMKKSWDCFYAIYNKINSSLENVENGSFVLARMKIKETELAIYPSSLFQN